MIRLLSPDEIAATEVCAGISGDRGCACGRMGRRPCAQAERLLLDADGDVALAISRELRRIAVNTATGRLG